MQKTVLRLKHRPTVPLEAEVLTPDVIAPLNHDAICALPVIMGKRQLRLEEFFDVEGDGSDQLELHGDLSRVKWIGRSMSRGRITIHGDAGMHLGAYMKGGAIHVSGSVSDWVGAEMRDGSIRIGGNAGGQIGAAYRGSLKGMGGGTILVEGSAGIEIGMRMRRGLIAVRGPVRDFAGLQMKGGTIVLMSGAEIRTGAWMARGTIVSLKPLRLMPTFSYACDYEPTFLCVYARYLANVGFAIPSDEKRSAYQRFTGDNSVPGKGEILIWGPKTT